MTGWLLSGFPEQIQQKAPIELYRAPPSQVLLVPGKLDQIHCPIKGTGHPVGSMLEPLLVKVKGPGNMEEEYGTPWTHEEPLDRFKSPEILK